MSDAATGKGKGDPLAIMVPCETCQGPHQYGERCGYCGTTDPPWLTGAGWPKPCLRCGSRDHKDCYAVSTDD